MVWEAKTFLNYKNEHILKKLTMLKNRLNPCQIKKQSKRMQVKNEGGNVVEARQLIN